MSEYDKPLDFWGQLWTMYPVWFPSSKYYNIFKNFRILVTILFFARVLAYIIYWITYSRTSPTKNSNLFVMFPNVYLLVYLVIAMLSVLAIQNVPVVYFLFPFLMLLAIIKEHKLHDPVLIKDKLGANVNSFIRKKIFNDH